MFQLFPLIESVALKRHPCSPRMVPPVAVIEPPQLVAALSPIPRITRYDWVAGDGIAEAVVDADADI